MTTINPDIKNSAIRELNKLSTERRANANIASATAWIGLGGIFATVPMSIRQRDWKVWALPFATAFVIAFAGYDDKQDKIPGGYKLIAWGSQAGLAAWFMKQNKDEAKIKLASEEAAE
jgi:hypothetical protein